MHISFACCDQIRTKAKGFNLSDKPKRRAPAFMLYVDDFLGGTSEMSAEEVGGYIRLLCHQWTKGGLPYDEPRLGMMAGLMGSPSLGYVIAKFTLCPDGKLRHPRLEALRTERDAFLTKQAESGREGAKKRWENRPPNGKPNGEPMPPPLATPMANECPNDGSPSPSPSPSSITPDKSGEGEKPDGKKPKKERKPVERNPIIDALVESCGGEIATTTRPAWIQAATALRDIKEVSPVVTVDDIKAKAAAYRKAHPEWDLTPLALAKHWGSLTERKQGTLMGEFDWRQSL